MSKSSIKSNPVDVKVLFPTTNGNLYLLVKDKITIKELAKKLGLSAKYMSHILHNPECMTIGKAQEICRLLGFQLLVG